MSTVITKEQLAQMRARAQAREERVIAGTASDEEIEAAASMTDGGYADPLTKIKLRMEQADRAAAIYAADAKLQRRRLGITEDTTAPEGSLILDRQVQPPQPHHLGIAADRGATLIYGRGGVGKGSYVAHLILRLIRELGWHIALIDSEERDYEWQPRLLALGATPEEAAHIFYIVPHGAIWDQTDRIQMLLEEHDFKPDLVIVDSVARTCRIDLSTGDDSLPARYYEALDSLCNRHLSIAHVTGAGNLEKPFGSQRWHDDARVTWSLEDKGEDKLLKLRKDNTALRPPNLLISIPAGNWTIIDGLPYPTNIIEGRYQEALADLIYGLLDESPMTYDQIVELVNETVSEDQKPHSLNAVKLAITRDNTGHFHRSGTKQRPLWSRSAPDTLRDTLRDTLEHTCARCGLSLEPEATNLEGTNYVHRGTCPQTPEETKA